VEVKLLFVTSSLSHGGAERQTIALANRLAERGHECHFAYLKPDAGQLERLRGAASVTCLQARRYLDFSALGALRRLARGMQSVVAVNQYAVLYARLAAPRLPLMATFHTTVLQGVKERLKMAYYRPFFWSADRLVFVCEAQRRYWARRRLAGRRTEVIYNGIDTDYWSPVAPGARRAVRRALGFAEGDLVIALSAVLRREKNPLQLVDAVAALRRRAIPAHALLVGDGPLRGAVEARARKLGIADQVVITGLQQDVRPMVGAADAAVLCSTAVETFSLAALEAMALGRPVVHAELGGAAEMIRSGADGWLFPAGDTAALVERLAALADPELRRRMGRSARERVEARFAEGAMVDRYEAALSELATTRSKHGNLRKPAGAH
jgi:glycosyltransferase involved in cell wall biosynthesis